MELTIGQKKALETLMSDKNVFLTGGAGTGKTTVMQEWIKEKDPFCYKTILCAPTGRAALNMKIETNYGTINGSTIHRVFGLKANGKFPRNPANNIPDELKIAERIVIDEVSMLRLDLFDYIAEVIIAENKERAFWRSKRPLQVVLVGDFYQLPPVMVMRSGGEVNDREKLSIQYGWDVGKGYCFLGNNWDRLHFITCDLTEVMRQKGDEKFTNSLNKIRTGDVSGIDYINNHCARGFKKERITICGTNKNAELINERELRKIPKPKQKFNADVLIGIDEQEARKYLKDCVCVPELELCEGARVICIANNKTAVNGQMGTVIGFDFTEDEILVEWDDGYIKGIEKFKWEITRQVKKTDDAGNVFFDSEPIMEIIQYPLKLAYAITVHKSQGATLEAVNIKMDLFETGHLYTALSRCPSIKNIGLEQPLTSKDVKCDKVINKFYKED